MTVTCAGLGTVTVSVPKPEQSQGAGQIIGSKGHLIPTSFVITATDLTTNTVIFSETTTKGGGHANANQDTTTCSAVFAEGTFAEVAPPGTPRPPGVGANDVIRTVFTVTVVVKP